MQGSSTRRSSRPRSGTSASGASASARRSSISKLATEHDVVKVLAKRFGFEVARFDQVEAYGHQQALSLVPREFALKHNVFPLAADTSTLAVAMSDPTNLAVIDELRFRSGRRVKVSIGGDREVATAIQAAYPSPDGGVEAIALDIDESSDEGESVMESFGGGSSQDFDSFFGADAAHAQGHDGAAAPENPFAADPVAAPVAVPVANPGQSQAAIHAPFPAPVPQPAPAAPARPAPGAAARPAPAPTAVRPAPAPGAAAGPVRPTAPAPARTPTVPGVRAVPAPLSTAARPAAPAGNRPQPAAPVRPAPVRPAPPTAAVAQPAAPVAISIDLETLPSPDALRDARARTGQAAPVPPVVEVEEELSPLLDEAPDAAVGQAGPLTPGEQAILTALQRLAEGGHAEPEVLKPTQAIAVLIRLLMRKGIVSERELLEALRKR